MDRGIAAARAPLVAVVQPVPGALHQQCMAPRTRLFNHDRDACGLVRASPVRLGAVIEAGAYYTVKACCSSGGGGSGATRVELVQRRELGAVGASRSWYLATHFDYNGSRLGNTRMWYL